MEYSEWLGGTPDGFVDDDGIIEVKCPYNGGNHLRSLLTGEVYNPEYLYQIQGYLWMTGRKWCDFITYDPDLIDALQINIIRVERDDSTIAGISAVMDVVIERIKQIMEQIEQL
jgi:exodeoxyribonuclease (lambda-induced)